MIERLSRNWWAAAGTAATILAVVVATGLPRLFPALGAWWVRLGLVLLVIVGLVAAGLVRMLKGRRASKQIAEEIAPANPGETEGEVLTARMRDAMAQLKTAAGGKRDYLYSRPWYLIIGPPGAGKTTALVNSGVRFPYADAALQGVGGTRNLDFWFADEAVLVDTAGRYTSQDSDAVVDAAGWERFLRLLRRARPLQPINGVLVAIGLDELMTADRSQIDAHAAALRRRLAELRRQLGVKAPVYLLFTKADLLAGFGEFFDDLNAEGRRAVLGATMPLGGRPDPARVAAEFDRLLQAMTARVSKRLQSEPDQRRRSLILGFPPQLETLRARFARLVDGAFLSEPEPSHTFRGFYFTSGVQEGAALDRVLSTMAEVYDEPQTTSRRGGRAYFINRLLGDVVFPEAGLVEPEPAIRRRRRALLLGGSGVIALVALAMIALWAGSFLRNRTLQDHLLAGGQEASRATAAAGLDLVEVRDNDPDLEQALPLLNQLRDLPRGFVDQAKGKPDWRMRLGLFQGGHAEAARQAYLNALQRILLPRLLLRLEHAMREDAQKPILLYEPLKTYLMLGGYGPLDRAAVRAWVIDDWRTNSLAGADRELVRTQLARHLDAMLADTDLGRVWPNRRAPLDGPLIDSTRAAVQTLSLADRAYAVLR
ncbi:MAG: type VI secretion system membrane subunit TssM, partial [Caulobacteraceae bacterium]